MATKTMAVARRKAADSELSAHGKVRAFTRGAGTVLALSGKHFSRRVSDRIGYKNQGGGIYRFAHKASHLYWAAFKQTRSETDNEA